MSETAVLDALTADLDEPAQVFAQGFRLAGRLHRSDPELSKVLLCYGFELSNVDKGFVPRVRRDIETASLDHLLHGQPERDDAEATDQVTGDLVRMLGLSAAEAREICNCSLPDLDSSWWRSSFVSA